MQKAPIPLDESRRLAAMRSLTIIDTPAEERFDRLTRLAMRIFAASASTISLVDESREWMKSHVGFQHEQIARGASIAAHAIGIGELLVIEDLSSDLRFRDHPLVSDGPRYRFFAGQPLHGPDGSQPGVLSIYGDEPREFTMADRQALSDLAAVSERELRESGLSGPQLAGNPAGGTSRVDPLTRLWNRTAVFEIIRRELEEARRAGSSVALLIIDLPPLPGIDSVGGQPSHDWALSEAARVLRASLRPYDVIGRFAGQELIALLTSVDPTSAVDAAERVRITIARDLEAGSGCEAAITIGATTATAQFAEPETLVRAAQSALWSAKNRGGRLVAFESITPAVPR